MGRIFDLGDIDMPLPDAPDYSQRIYELLKETDLENLSYSQFQGVAEKLFIEPENEDEMRRLVLIQLARMAVRGDWDGFLTGGGGSAAPTDAEYVVMSLNGTLTDERVLTAGTGISITDGGAGGDVTIASTVTGIGGSIATTQVAVGSGTDTISGSGSLTYSSNVLAVSNQIELSDVGSAGILKNSQSNQDLRLQVVGTGNVRVENQTVNTDSQLNVKGNGTGTPKLILSNDTKAVTVQCDENQKIKVDGGGGSSFVLDASSSTGGITWPDGTTQITAATGGGGGGGSGFIQPPTASGAIAASYNKYPIFSAAPYGNGDINGVSTTAYNTYPCMRPFVLGEGGTWGGAALWVDTASISNSLLISLYQSDSDGMPAAFIGYCEVSTNATGSITQTTTLDSGGSSASFTLTKDTQYWCSFVMANSGDGATLRSVNVDGLTGLGNSNMSKASGVLRNINVSNAIETTNPPRNNQIIDGTVPHIGLIM